MKLLRVLSLGAVALSLGCGSKSSTGTAGPGANEVWMQNTAFKPATRNVSTGTTVTFTNMDNFAHTVTASSVPGGAVMFDSGLVTGGMTFQVMFTMPGTYLYQCTIHGGMTGTITVS